MKISSNDFTKASKFSGESYGTKIELTIDHSDLDINEVFDAFHTIVIGLGFSEETWKEWIFTAADEYREDENAFLKEKINESNDDEDLFGVNDQRYSKIKKEDENEYIFEWESDEYDDDLDKFYTPNDRLKEAAESFNKKLSEYNKNKKK